MCFRIAALLCISYLIDGCSFKEDRGECPCSLRLVIDDACLSGPVDLAWTILNADMASVSAYGEIPDAITLDVPRCLADICVNVSGPGVMNKSGGLDIAAGDDCPPVFRCRTKVDCRRDYAEGMMDFHKNYAELSCVLEHSGALGPGLEYCVEGNVCGYDVEGAPVPGPFQCALKCRKNSSGTMLAEVALPRQTDNSLKLKVSAPDGELLREFALGEYIAASGYDWSAADLEDIVIRINIASTTLSVNILSGNQEIHLSYRI